MTVITTAPGAQTFAGSVATARQNSGNSGIAASLEKAAGKHASDDPTASLSQPGLSQTGESRLADWRKALETTTRVATASRRNDLGGANRTRVATASRRNYSGDAKERLRKLVEQVKLLKQLNADPKVIAKEAARLAKEIAQAAKEYANNADSPADAISSTIGSASGGLAAVQTQTSAFSLSISSESLSIATAAAGGRATASGTAGLALTAPAGMASLGVASVEAASFKVSTVELSAVEVLSTGGSSGEARQAVASAETTRASALQLDQQPGRGDAEAPSNAVKLQWQQVTQRLSAAGDAGKARSDAITAEREFFLQVKSAVASLRIMVERGAQEADRHRHDRLRHGRERQEKDEQAKAVDKADKEVDGAIHTIGDHGEGESPAAAANDTTSPSAGPETSAGNSVTAVAAAEVAVAAPDTGAAPPPVNIVV